MRKIAAAGLFAGLLLGGSAYAQDGAQDAIDKGNLSGALTLLGAQSGAEDVDASLAGLVGEAQILHAAGKDASEQLDAAAKKLADKKMKKNPYQVIVPYLKASIARSKDDAATAEEQIKVAIGKLGDTKIGPLWQGLVHYEASFIFGADNGKARGEAEAAVKAFGAAKANHELGHAQLRLGELEFERKKARKAFQEYDNAISAFRNDGNVQRCIAEAQLLVVSRQIENGENAVASSRFEIAQKEVDAAGSPKDLADKVAELKAKLAN